jgi:ABC-type multidrug transport system fused ATPase/permease subunit
MTAATGAGETLKPSGSGKTTLTTLLLRLHDPTTGAIRLDGCITETGNHPQLLARDGGYAHLYLYRTHQPTSRGRHRAPEASPAPV